MDVSHEFLSIRYARALLNKVDCPYDEGLAMRLHAMALFLTHYRIQLVGVSVQFYTQLFSVYQVQQCRFDLIFALLQKNRRDDLISDVLRSFVKCYEQKHHIFFSKVFSSHVLTAEQKHELDDFVVEASGQRFFFETKIDKSLIAGIRIEGDLLMWENSISQKLQAIEQKR